MHMFCFQCQETSEGRGCTSGGVCGKSEETANFQDLLIHTLKGLALVQRAALRPAGVRAVGAPGGATGSTLRTTGLASGMILSALMRWLTDTHH